MKYKKIIKNVNDVNCQIKQGRKKTKEPKVFKSVKKERKKKKFSLKNHKKIALIVKFIEIV